MTPRPSLTSSQLDLNWRKSAKMRFWVIKTFLTVTITQHSTFFYFLFAALFWILIAKYLMFDRKTTIDLLSAFVLEKSSSGHHWWLTRYQNLVLNTITVWPEYDDTWLSGIHVNFHLRYHHILVRLYLANTLDAGDGCRIQFMKLIIERCW